MPEKDFGVARRPLGVARNLDRRAPPTTNSGVLGPALLDTSKVSPSTARAAPVTVPLCAIAAGQLNASASDSAKKTCAISLPADPALTSEGS